MKENNQSKTNEKKEGLATFRPEDEIYQKLLLCELLSELSEGIEEDKQLSEK